MQNASLRIATGCTQDTDIHHLHDGTLTHTSHSRSPTATAVPIQTENTISRTRTYNILQHSNAKNAIFNNGHYTTIIFPQVLTQSPHNRHKTNMRHIQTSIVSMHLATKCNNEIRRTPPPHITSSENILPHLTRRTPFPIQKTYITISKILLYNVDNKSHPSPICPLCNTHTHDTTSYLFNYTHIHTTLSSLDFWTDPAGLPELPGIWTEKLTGWTTSG